MAEQKRRKGVLGAAGGAAAGLASPIPGGMGMGMVAGSAIEDYAGSKKNMKRIKQAPPGMEDDFPSSRGKGPVGPGPGMEDPDMGGPGGDVGGGPPLEEPQMGDEAPPEKYSAQLLRRIHQDSGVLMQEYDEAMAHLEHEEIGKFIHKILESMDANMTAIEELMRTHHPESEPLEGSMEPESGIPEEDMQGNPPPDLGEPVDKEEGMEEEGAPIDAEEDINGEETADSLDREEEEPTPEEAMEGMDKVDEEEEEFHKSYKAFPEMDDKEQRSGSSKADSAIDKAGNKIDSANAKTAIGEGLSDAHVKKNLIKSCGVCGKDKCVCKSFSKQGKSIISETIKMLGDLAVKSTAEFGDTHRLNCYHMHKMLEKLTKAMPGEEEKDLEPDFFKAFGSAPHAGTAPSASPGSGSGNAPEDGVAPEDKYHKALPPRRVLSSLSKYLHSLSFEKAFGEAHREKTKAYHSMMKNVEEVDKQLEEKALHTKARKGGKKIRTLLNPRAVHPKDTYKSLPAESKELKDIAVKQLTQIDELSKKLSALTNGRFL